MSELLCTQSQEYTNSQIAELTESQTAKLPWGRLVACCTTLDSIELVKDCYTFGRALTSSVVLEPTQLPNILSISKNHCKLYMEDNFVYLEDLSKNGTFIGKRPIGKFKRKILCSNEVIAFGHPTDNKAYVFFRNSPQTSDFPVELREKYFLSKLLGKGGSGEVHLAFDRQTSEKFAIKKIIKPQSSELMSCLNAPGKIRTEIKILTTLSHPFIIQMLDAFETERGFYIVLEYLAGGELTGRIMSVGKPFPENEIRHVFYQILQGLQYLHAKGITHRDIKASNILLTSDTNYPDVKITDFGLSKIMDTVSFMETACGTISYVAPEIIKLSPRYGKAVDVWSFGVLLFYMTFRTLPFLGSTREEVAKKIIVASIQWGSNLTSSSCRDLIKKMLTVDPIKRIRIKDIFEHPWIKKINQIPHKVERNTWNDDTSSESSDDFRLVKRARLM